MLCDATPYLTRLNFTSLNLTLLHRATHRRVDTISNIAQKFENVK